MAPGHKPTNNEGQGLPRKSDIDRPNGYRDLSRYAVAPDGHTAVRKPESLLEQLTALKIRKRPSYTPFGDELNVMKACVKAKLPLMLWGSPGTGKTTAVTALAYDMEVPLITTMGSEGMHDYDLTGYQHEVGDWEFWDDKPLSLAARSGVPCILYIDEAIEITRGVFTTISEALDNRRQLSLSTGETLSTRDVTTILAFNPPRIEYRDMLFTEATLDRFVPIPFPRKSGDEVLVIFKEKYRDDQIVSQIIAKYGETLKTIYDNLNGDVFRRDHAEILYGEATPRSFEKAILMMAAGLDPRMAAMYGMIRGLAPFEDPKVESFREAANRMLDASAGLEG